MLKRTNIYLRPETIAHYKARAKRNGTTMADEMRAILYHNMTTPKHSWQDSVQNMIDTAGTGPKDLSRNHDTYLYDKRA